MKKQMKKTKSGGNGTKSSKPKPKPEQVDKALLAVQDILERSHIKFLLLGETLRSIKEDDRLQGNKIELGIKLTELSKYGLSTLVSLVPGLKLVEGKKKKNIINFKKLVFKINEVPVEIKVIHKKYTFVDNPDAVFYGVEQYLIPNPWKKYYKMRGFVR